MAARHPNNPGLTAMSSNEGPVEGVGGGSDADSSKRLSGGGGGSGGSAGISGGGGGVTKNTAAAAAAGEGGNAGVAGGSANLMLYTACEEGFVKTWRVGKRGEKGKIVGAEVTDKTVYSIDRSVRTVRY